LSIASGACGKSRGPSQKLPSTAIYCHFGAARSLLLFQSLHSLSCPSRRADQPGLGLRTASGAVRSPGAKLPSRASLSHDRRIRQKSENDARRGDRRGYGCREVGVEQRGAGTDRLPLGRRKQKTRGVSFSRKALQVEQPGSLASASDRVAACPKRNTDQMSSDAPPGFISSLCCSRGADERLN
jgi:hypothetical protein